MTTQRGRLVVVAGSGASGLVAALAASVGGANVLVVERAAELGGTTALGGGRVWVPANHCPENAGDSPEAALTYLDGLFPARYAHMTDAFVANAPRMARFVEDHTPHRFAACAHYPDYHPERPGATLGGRCLDMLPADTSRMVPAGPPRPSAARLSADDPRRMGAVALSRPVRLGAAAPPGTRRHPYQWRRPGRLPGRRRDPRWRRGSRPAPGSPA